MPRLLAFLLVLLWMAPSWPGRALDLDALLDRHGFAADEAAVLIEAYAGSETVLDHRADQALVPGSTLKLLTAIGVLERLGHEHRFATRLLVRGVPSNGGATAVILVGGGDPELDVDGLMRLALALKDAGIAGAARFVVDDTALPRLPLLRADQPLEDAYNTGIGALTLAFNRVQVKTGPDGRRWTLPALDEPVVVSDARELPVRDAGLHAARALRRLAAGLGVALPDPERGRAETDDREIKRVWSKTTEALVQDMLLYSNNQLAEILGLAATGAAGVGASIGALRAEVAALAPEAGLEALGVPNHSGLAPEARATPEQLVALLRLGQDRHGLLAMLPASGWSGSLAQRLDGDRQALRVWAKTGSLDYALALAGLVLPESGPPLLLALMIADLDARRDFDRVLPPTPSLRAAADAWAERARALRDALVAEVLRGEGRGSGLRP